MSQTSHAADRPPARNITQILIGVCVSCFVLCLLLIGWSIADRAAYQAKTDNAVSQLQADSNAYRKKLASLGVNPNSVAPPPEQRTAPLAVAGSPGVPGTNGRDGQDGRPGADGSPGPAGSSPPCLAEPTQCKGDKGDKGDAGDKGQQGEMGPPGPASIGEKGDSIATVVLRPVEPGQCTLGGTFTNGASWTAAGATVPCVVTEPSTPPPTTTPAGLRKAPAAIPTRAAPRPSTAASRAATQVSPTPARRVPPGLPLDWPIMLVAVPQWHRRTLGERNP